MTWIFFSRQHKSCKLESLRTYVPSLGLDAPALRPQNMLLCSFDHCSMQNMMRAEMAVKQITRALAFYLVTANMITAQ